MRASGWGRAAAANWSAVQASTVRQEVGRSSAGPGGRVTPPFVDPGEGSNPAGPTPLATAHERAHRGPPG